MSVPISTSEMVNRCTSIAMRLPLVVAALALLGLAAATSAQAQRIGQELQVGSWTILNPGTEQGEFTVCLAVTRTDGGGGLGIMSDGSGAALYVNRPRQNLTPGTRYDVAYSYDGGRWTRASGRADTEVALSIIIPGPIDAALRDFADMDDIEVQLPNNITVTSSLAGSGAAITALRRCVQNSRPR